MRKRHIPVSPTKQSGFQSIDEEDLELRTMDEEEGKPLMAAFETILPTFDDRKPLSLLPRNYTGRRRLAFAGIGFLVTLGSRSPYRWAFLRIQHAKLDTRHIGRLAHLASHGIDLASKMSLGQSSNRWVAGHLSDGVDIDRKHHGLTTHASCRQGGLNARMTTTDDKDIKRAWIGIHSVMVN